MLDNYVKMYYNAFTKGVVNMDFLDRLQFVMDKNGDNKSTLSEKSGIPYTTIVGLFKRNWEKAQVCTIRQICDHYGVSLDYMVYGAEKLSNESLIVAAKYEEMSPYGKAIIDCVIEQEKANRISNIKAVPVIDTVHDSDLYARYNAKRERQELEQEQKTENKSE